MVTKVNVTIMLWDNLWVLPSYSNMILCTNSFSKVDDKCLQKESTKKNLNAPYYIGPLWEITYCRVKKELLKRILLERKDIRIYVKQKVNLNMKKTYKTVSCKEFSIFSFFFSFIIHMYIQGLGQIIFYIFKTSLL
jgi:hypothetical protein